MQRRLGRDDFVAAKQIGLSPYSPPDGEWMVCSDYRIRDGCIWAKYPMSEDTFQEWRAYKPLTDKPDLFLEFARLYERGCTAEQILEWTRKHGVLNRGLNWSGGPGESMEGFWEQATQAAGLLAMYEAALHGDEKKAERLIFDEFSFLTLARLDHRWHWALRLVRDALGEPLASEFREVSEQGLRSLMEFARSEPKLTELLVHEFLFALSYDNYLEYVLDMPRGMVGKKVKDLCYPILDVQDESPFVPSNIRAGFGFRNLLGAMYLQMYWLMTAGGEITHCQYCGRVIPLSAFAPSARKTRQDKKFCNDACRQRYHYHNKTKPRRQSNRT